MESNKRFITEFILGKKSFHFVSEWKSDSFVLIICDGKYTWKGEVTRNDLENMKPEDMSLEDFLQLSKEAIIKQDREKNKYWYKISQLNHNGTQIKLTWKMKLAEIDKERDLDISLVGFIILNMEENSRITIQSIINEMLIENETLLAHNNDLKKLNDSLMNQRSETLVQLDKIIHDKQILEEEMYKKFASILNEKKKKIRELKDKIVQLESKVSNCEINSPKKTPSKSDSNSSNSLNLNPSLSLERQKSWNSPTLDLINDGTPPHFMSPVRKRKIRKDEKDVSPISKNKKRVIRLSQLYSDDESE